MTSGARAGRPAAVGAHSQTSAETLSAAAASAARSKKAAWGAFAFQRVREGPSCSVQVLSRHRLCTHLQGLCGRAVADLVAVQPAGPRQEAEQPGACVYSLRSAAPSGGTSRPGRSSARTSELQPSERGAWTRGALPRCGVGQLRPPASLLLRGAHVAQHGLRCCPASAAAHACLGPASAAGDSQKVLDHHGQSWAASFPGS